MSEGTPIEVTDTIPEDNQTYKLKEYWDSRFEKEEKYEWLASYDELKDLVSQYIQKTDRILLLGCGNSQLGPQMCQDGYSSVVSSDFSETVITNMKTRFPDYQWIVSDAKDLKEFEDNSFDIVFDKATMDALVTDEGSCWDPNPETISDCKALCEASLRVLKKGGKFLQLTFQDPYFRKRYLLSESLKWTQTNYHKVDVGLGYHFFVLKKD